ncbi:unnamed protein product [Effrenium voratum]|nr:unnamed protein product [Effrenium voratum]
MASWAEEVQTYQHERRVKLHPDLFKGPTVGYVRGETSKRERSFNPLLGRFLDPQREQEQQSFEDETKRGFLNLARDVQLRREAPFDLVTHERKFQALVPQHQDPGFEKEPKRPFPGTAADYNIISNVSFDQHHWAHPDERPVPKDRVPKKRLIPAMLHKDFNILTNRYREHHEAKIARDQELNLLEAADKLRKTKPFDPVQQKFCDEDMENRMRACQDALTTEIKLRGEEVQPLSYRGNISNSYDLLSHQVKDPELLELINSADEARNARFKHRRAFEERVKRDAEQQQDRVARMKPGQVAHERFVTAMDRGFANEDFAHKGPNKKFAPRTKPGRTPWEKVGGQHEIEPGVYTNKHRSWMIAWASGGRAQGKNTPKSSPVAMGRLGPRCTHCKRTEEADLTCGRCRSVVYCSRSCQRAHWKSHKLDCVKLAQVLAKRAEGDVAGWWYDFESWRDVSPSYLEQQGLELEDVTNCPRQQRRTRQKQNEQIRKAFDVHERLRVMRLVDLAFRHDPRLLWERNAAAGDESRTRAPQKKTSAPRSPQRRKEPSEEELRKQEETKRVAKSRRQQLRKLVESLGLLVSGVELERFCLKATDTEELEDLAEEVGRLAQLPPEDVTEELTETDEEDSKSKKKEEAVVPDCTFCHGTGMNAVSKTVCMFCDGSGKQHVEEAPAEEVEEAPPKEKRYRRKTPLQLAQEAVFDAMWASGMRPTETRHSPELRQERRERQEREREERRRLRELRQKEEREREQQLRAEQAKEEETIEEQFARRAAAREARAAEEEAKAEPEQNEPEEELDEDPRLVAEAERFLSQDQDTNPETVDRISKLTEFARLGIEGATQVILASLGASKELRECLAELEERRFEQPEEYTNEVLLLLSECVAPFFGLGTRPVKAVKLPALLRNRAKRVRQALRDLVLGCNFLAILEGQN